MTVVQLSIRLLLFILAGFIARKVKAMPDGFDRMLSRFVMAVPLPCMIISSFRMEYSLDQLLTAPLLIALAVGSMAALKKIVMSDCGISNEEMDALNRKFDDVRVVWTVYERILRAVSGYAWRQGRGCRDGC